MSMKRKGDLLFLCLPLGMAVAAIAAAGDRLVRHYPAEQRLDLTVFVAIGAVILGVLATGAWSQVALARAGSERLDLLADSQQSMHDFAWLPVAFALYLSTPLFVIAVAALTGSWYMLDRLVKAEREGRGQTRIQY